MTGVTVVIPCHSDREWDGLVRTVAAAHAQVPPPDAVVVVVDHNDGLFERARAAFPRTTVVRNTGSRGASGARNAGARLATTPLVAFVDGDAVPRPGWLAALLAPFADPRVTGTGGRIVPAWAGARPGWLPDEFLWTVGASHLPDGAADHRVRNVWSGNMAVRRDAFVAVGGFRDGFGKVGNRSRPEDTDLCVRMGRSGEWRLVPGAVVDHGVPATHTTYRYFLRRCYAEGRGKVSMARLLGGRDDLAVESDWLRDTVRSSVRRLARGGAERRRGGAAVTGLAAASVGAAVEVLTTLPVRTPR